VRFEIGGESGGVCPLVRDAARWELYEDVGGTPDATVKTDADSAWRLFTKGITAQEARPRARVEGQEALGPVIFSSVAIIA
jgi:hypothetical protein